MGTSAAGTFESVPIGKVRTGDVRTGANIRTQLGDLSALAQSIAAVGILEPILVTQHGSGYIVVVGHRRLAAARKARLKEIPVIVRDKFPGGGSIEAMLIENLQREDLPPTDEAAAYRQLVDEHGYNQKRLAERVGRSQGHISKRLSLLELTDKGRAAVDAGTIHVEEAIELARLKDHPKRMDAVIADGAAGYRIRQELEAIEVEGKIAAATARLQSAGTKIVGWEPGSYGGERLRGAAVPVTEGYLYEAHVKMAPGAHAKQACHAAAISSREGTVLEVCTSPKNHPKEHVPSGGYSATGKRQPGPLSEKERGARKAKRDHNKAIREAEVARWEFLRELFSRAIPLKHREVALRFVVDAWANRETGTSYEKQGRSAADLLGLKKGSFYNYREPVLRHLAKAPGDGVRIALAIGVGSFEDGIRADLTSGWSGSWARSKAYFAWLKEGGYQVSEAERVAISGKAPA